jgi:hypothetical protein
MMKKVLTKKAGKCKDCGEPTDFKGWYWVHSGKKKFSIGGGKKVYSWYCGNHFLTHMFNLWPFTCTRACQEKHGKVLGVRLKGDDNYVWLDLSNVLVPAIPVAKMKAGVSYPLKPLAAKCPWCGKGMKVVARHFAKQ